MEKKTASDMRAYLSSFEPEYPVKKGYIARLIVNEKLANGDIYKMIKGMVQMAEPDRQINEKRLRTSVSEIRRHAAKKRHYTSQWANIVKLNQQPFHISFLSGESLSSSAATSTSVLQPGHTGSPLIQTDHSSVALIQTDNSSAPLIPTNHVQLTSATPWIDDLPSNSIPNESLSVSLLPRSPSPKRLKRDCDNCVAKQRTSLNMLKENRHLRLQIRALRIRHREEKKQMSPKTLNLKIKRKSESFDLWRVKHSDLNKQFKGQEMQHMIQEMLSRKKHEEEINALTITNRELEWKLKKYEEKTLI